MQVMEKLTHGCHVNVQGMSEVTTNYILEMVGALSVQVFVYATQVYGVRVLFFSYLMQITEYIVYTVTRNTCNKWN